MDYEVKLRSGDDTEIVTMQDPPAVGEKITRNGRTWLVTAKTYTVTRRKRQLSSSR